LYVENRLGRKNKEYMTAQIPDKILINEKSLSIVGVNGGELFTPQSVGITPIPIMTACWRGYICQYKIRDGKLILDQLQVSLGLDDTSGKERKFVPQMGPVINGVNPTDKHPAFSNIYEGLNLEIDFTGGILAGEGFIQTLYVHMGFHPAWKYQTVFELIFDHGNVKELRDVSVQIEQLRSKMTELPLKPDILESDKAEVEAWIDKTFRLGYDLKPRNPG
jgi:hypothetical protein